MLIQSALEMLQKNIQFCFKVSSTVSPVTLIDINI